jgi:hypothetical protein
MRTARKANRATYRGRLRVIEGGAGRDLSPETRRPDLAEVVVVLDRWTELDKSSSVEVASDYSRSTWLPVVGPAPWLIWAAMADRLRGTDRVECSLDDIASSCGGFALEDVVWSLHQLAHHGLTQLVGDGSWRVQATCPPAPCQARGRGGLTRAGDASWATPAANWRHRVRLRAQA